MDSDEKPEVDSASSNATTITAITSSGRQTSSSKSTKVRIFLIFLNRSSQIRDFEKKNN